MAKVITVQKGGFVKLEEFRDILDVDRVSFYELKYKKDGSIVVKFYDNKKKRVRPYAAE